MKPTAMNFGARGIHNAYGLGKLQDSPKIYLAYRTQQTGRWFRSAAWRVVDADGGKTDPDEETRAWDDGGHKTFALYGSTPLVKQREPLRLKALDWIAERYSVDVERWERSVWGSWHPAGTLARAMALPDDWEPEPYELPPLFREIEHPGSGIKATVRADGHVSGMVMFQMGPEVKDPVACLREYEAYVRLIREAVEDAISEERTL